MSVDKPDASRLDDDDFADVPPYLSEHLRCAICSYIGVVWESLPCAHSFCGYCTHVLVKRPNSYPRIKASTCPLCRQPFRRREVKPAMDKNSLSSVLPVRCDRVGRENGCDWTGTLDSRVGHLAACGYQLEVCPHESCLAHPLKKDLDDHWRTCRFRVVKCSYEGCSVVFQQQYRTPHENSCMRRPVLCDLCQESMPLENLEHHKESECEEGIVTCAEEFTKNQRSADAETRSSTDVVSATAFFASTCPWEGKRGSLAQHRAACISFGICTIVLPLFAKVETLERSAKNQQRVVRLPDPEINVPEEAEATTYVWDIPIMNAEIYEPGDAVESPEFNLCGRKWHLRLYPAGTAEGSDEYGLFLKASLPEDIRLKTRFVLREMLTQYGEYNEALFTSDSSSWGYSKFAVFPAKFGSIQVE
eukprot:Rmarinus@m.3999